MQRFSSFSLPALLVVASLVLTACESAEERAEKRFQSGLSLIEEGDFDRAIVEFRSVFELEPNHFEARQKLAELLLSHQNNRQGAYSQYLRLAEQYPDDLETRLTLVELAFLSANWDEVDRHGDQAVKLAPEDPRVAAVEAVRAYRTAAMDEDNAARRDHARTVQALLDGQPENKLLRSVVIDNHVRENELTEALAGLDWMLEREPDEVRLWRQRLRILAQLEDADAMEVQLREMVERFDEDDSHKTTLIRFYLSRDANDKAEGFLRELAEASDEIDPRIDLIRFITETRGMDAARAEVANALTEFPGNVRLRIVGAGLDFTAGDQDTAIRALEQVLEDAPDSEFGDEARVALARMLLQTGNEVGARARVEEALSANPENPDALKMRANWLIQSDDTNQAIAALRTALDARPEDAAAMTLMAQAYTRAGRQDLARDFLALAVEASGNAPTETARYARILIEEERYLPAEDILLPALRLAPQNPELLLALGQLYLGMDDLDRVQQVAQALRDIGNDATTELANQLDAERINQQQGADEALNYLASVANSADATLASQLTLVRAWIQNGKIDNAIELVRTLFEENPDNFVVKSVVAAVETLGGNLDRAEELYTEILEEQPEQGRIWLQLSQIKALQGDTEASREVLRNGLDARPDDISLMWAMASMEERDGNIEEAIAIYEDVYEDNSNVLVIANNLASLLTTHRTDPESLERAWTIARRLRDTDVPAMQDTYGWILHRRGESEEALPYVEAALRGLPNDALVAYHAGEVYRALGRTEDALTSYRRSVEIAGGIDTRPQIVDARAKITELENAPADTAAEPSE